MKLNFDFQGVFKSINLKENFNFGNCVTAYNNIKSYAANAFKSCEEDISLFLEGKPFVFSNINYNDLSNKLIRVRKNIENGLKGGKGGFGATIKSQKKKVNVRELTVGLCRDLKTGRRIKDLNTTQDSADNNPKGSCGDNSSTSATSSSSSSSSSSSASKALESSSSVSKEEGEIMTQYQSHIFSLEDRWRSISASIDFGMKNMSQKAGV